MPPGGAVPPIRPGVITPPGEVTPPGGAGPKPPGGAPSPSPAKGDEGDLPPDDLGSEYEEPVDGKEGRTIGRGEGRESGMR